MTAITLNPPQKANVPFDPSVPEHHPEGDVQDAGKIYAALEGCVDQIPESLATKISKIGICGQVRHCHFLIVDCDTARYITTLENLRNSSYTK